MCSKMTIQTRAKKSKEFLSCKGFLWGVILGLFIYFFRVETVLSYAFCQSWHTRETETMSSLI